MTAVVMPELVWRLLGPADCDQVFALHQAATEGMGVDQVLPEQRAFFEALLAGGGMVVGMCDPAGELIAYGVLQHGPDPGTRPDLWLGWPADACIQKLAGSSVAPAYRGQRLQCALIRQRVALADPDAYLYATAAPSNPASWRNLLREGFEIQGLRRVYQDSLRYLLVRRAGLMTASADPECAGGLALDSLSLPQQDQLLAQGWRGRWLAGQGCVLTPPEPRA